MKKIFLVTVIFFLSFTLVRAQSVGINTTTPHSSAILDVKSSTKGMLIPRTSTASRTAIVNPAKGLMIYDTTTSSVWFHNGSAWSQITVGSNGWNLTGNTGINPANQFIGTTDAQSLRFRVNNAWAGEIHPGNANIFLGVSSGQANTTGEANTSIGEHSLAANTEGTFNTAGGYYALAVNTTGFNNTAHGAYALSSNTTGRSNTALGRNALFANTAGNYNIAAGEGALLTNTTGSYNTANGYQALFSNSNGSFNTGNGAYTLYSNSGGTSNTANGYTALKSNSTGNNNTATGYLALYSNSTGSRNTATGESALLANTIGIYNTASGSGALFSNVSGNNNTATGADALGGNISGSYNTANGMSALSDNSTGDYNTASGMYSLGHNTTGALNTANGYAALYQNTTGNNNVASGYGALQNNIDGVFNTAAGYLALYSNNSGWYNTAFGDGALFNNVGGLYNVALGFSSGTASYAPNVSNTVSIGNDGSFLNGASNQVILGNASTVFIGGKVNWGIVSDARIKNSVQEDVKGLSFILKLRPVTYHISNKAIADLTGNKDTTIFPGKYDGEKIKYTGFLAQEVEQAAKAAGYDFSGYTKPTNPQQLYTIRYAEFVVPLVKAIQEQQLMIAGLQKQVEAAKSAIPIEIGKQQTIIDELKKEMADMKKEMELLKQKN